MYRHILLEKVLNPPQLSRARHTVRALAFLMNKRTNLNSLFVSPEDGSQGGFGQGRAVVNCAEHPSFLCTDFPSTCICFPISSFLNSVLTIRTSPPVEAFPNTPQGGQAPLVSPQPHSPTSPLYQPRPLWLVRSSKHTSDHGPPYIDSAVAPQCLRIP